MALMGTGRGLATLLQEYADAKNLSIDEVITDLVDEVQDHVAGEGSERAPLEEIDLYLRQAQSSLEEALENLEEVAQLRTNSLHNRGAGAVVMPEEILSLLERVRAEIEGRN